MGTQGGGDARLTELVPYDCWRLVEESVSHVGIARVVWTAPGGPAIVPVNYAVADGAVWFQTSPASRLARECPGQEVLVEVDHVEPETLSGWSVVATGSAELVTIEDVPDILGSLRVWPAGAHTVFVRVEPRHLTGRRLLPHH